MNKVVASAIAAATIAGGSFAIAVASPFGVASAQDNGSTTVVPGAGAAPTGHSNEDPAHEALESPEREAAEDAGTFHGGGHGHDGHSNEDPAHEALESPEREAAEDAGSGGGAGTHAPTTPSTGAGTATATGVSFRR